MTLLRGVDETTDECDARLCQLLGVDPVTNDVTATVYEPADNGFRKLKG